MRSLRFRGRVYVFIWNGPGGFPLAWWLWNRLLRFRRYEWSKTTGSPWPTYYLGPLKVVTGPHTDEDRRRQLDEWMKKGVKP